MGGSATHRIIVFGEPRGTKQEFEALARAHHVTIFNTQTRDEAISSVRKAASEGDIDVVLTMFYHPKGPIDEELLAPLKGKLKFVGGQGAGYDRVDIKWLTSIGAWYSNTPNSLATPTATSALMLILDCIGHAAQLDAAVKRGDWHKDISSTPDVRDLVIGIVGMGMIGSLVRDKAQTLGMRVIYNNRKRLPPDQERGATYVPFTELLTSADLITLHCPLTPETHHLLSTKEFDMMKQGTMIVNTSRGKVIDEEALVSALKSGKVDRAGLDVFENEPEIHPYLKESDRCSLRPHWAACTTRMWGDSELEVLENLESWMKNGVPKSPVNHVAGSGH